MRREVAAMPRTTKRLGFCLGKGPELDTTRTRDSAVGHTRVGKSDAALCRCTVANGRTTRNAPETQKRRHRASDMLPTTTSYTAPIKTYE